MISNLLNNPSDYINNEHENICKDGTRVWVGWTNKAIIDNSNNISEIICIGNDITERKQLEMQLSKNEKRYRQLFENIFEGVAIYQEVEDGNDFVLVDFNKKAQEIENISKEDIIGKKVTEVFPGVIDFGLFDVFKRVSRTGKSAAISERLFFQSQK